MPKFVIFDLDDTLVDSAGAVDRWFLELIERASLGPQALDFLREEQKRPVSPEESFRAIVQQFGLAESPEELRRYFSTRMPQLARTFDGVPQNLRALRERGWVLALLTNGTKQQQQPKLHDGLADLFDVVCFADDEVASKPDPQIFRIVAERAGVQLAGGWMVGDSLDTDIAGSTALGMSTIWVSHGQALPVGAPIPGEVVKTVAEAFPILLAT